LSKKLFFLIKLLKKPSVSHPFSMEELLSNDRQISSHRIRQDYKPSPLNTLQFSYGDRRYEKFTYELSFVSDILKLKTLREINEDFHRADLITLALLSSGLLAILLDHFSEENQEIRELVSRAVVIFINFNDDFWFFHGKYKRNKNFLGFLETNQ